MRAACLPACLAACTPLLTFLQASMTSPLPMFMK
jgi:hypothetical protein